MRMLWLHIRNSPIRWALPILVILDLAVLFIRSRHWIGVWPDTGATAQIPAYLVGVVGAGAAAWSATATDRHSTGEQLNAARVHPATMEGYRLGATIVILLIPYLVGQAAGFVLTARTFPPGLHLWLGYVVLGVFITLLSIAVGWTMGKIFGSVFAALVAALGFPLLVGFLDRQGGFIVVSGRSPMTVDVMALTIRFGAVSALLLALLWIPGSGRPRGRHLPLPIAAALVLAVALSSTAPVVPREPAGDRARCVAGPTLLCVWPESEKYVPQLDAVNSRIAELPDAFVLPPRVNEWGIDTGLQYGNYTDERLENPDAAPYFHILEGSPWSYVSDIGRAITDATFEFQNYQGCRWASTSVADTDRLQVVDAWLESYLVGATAPDFRTDASAETQSNWAEGRAMLDLPRAEQFSWAEGEVDELRGRYCRSGQ